MKRKLTPTIRGPMLPAMSRIPADVLEYIDKVADQQLRSRSDIIRSLVVAQLRAEGVVAPVDADEAAA